MWVNACVPIYIYVWVCELVSGGMIIIMYRGDWSRCGWTGCWRVGRSGAHARCFNGLMSIYGLSSELTARRAVYVLHKCAPPSPQCPIIPSYKGHGATRTRGADVEITCVVASVQGRTAVFIPLSTGMYYTQYCTATEQETLVVVRPYRIHARYFIIQLLLLLLQ